MKGGGNYGGESGMDGMARTWPACDQSPEEGREGGRLGRTYMPSPSMMIHLGTTCGEPAPSATSKTMPVRSSTVYSLLKQGWREGGREGGAWRVEARDCSTGTQRVVARDRERGREGGREGGPHPLYWTSSESSIPRPASLWAD